MDIFTFPVSGNSFDLTNGKIVNDYDRATWVERFNEASEFTIEGRVDSGLREQMPLGHLVSHTDTDEVMVVEDHQIKSGQGISSLVVTGQAYEKSVLENRIINSNKAWTAAIQAWPQSQYILGLFEPGYACLQARYLISRHIDWQDLIDDNDALPQTNVYLDVAHINATYGPPLLEAEEDTFDRIPVYEGASNALAVDNLGMRTRRPRGLNLDDGLDSVSRYGENWLTIYIYAGFDRRNTVQFSHRVGDIAEAEYLWSNRVKKTSCLVYSRYFAVMVHGPETGYARKVMTLDAKDLDEQYDTIPTGATQTRLLAALKRRGKSALAKKNSVAIASVQLNDKDHTYKFRQDYNLGDYVSVYGEYNASTSMQVTEHVEIDDVTGSTSYPTLSEITGGYYVPIGRY
jgi:hypothetical protein